MLSLVDPFLRPIAAVLAAIVLLQFVHGGWTRLVTIPELKSQVTQAQLEAETQRKFKAVAEANQGQLQAKIEVQNGAVAQIARHCRAVIPKANEAGRRALHETPLPPITDLNLWLAAQLQLL